MEEIEAVGGAPIPFNATPPPDASSATDGFGLQFEALLQIVLTQLQFQDPLKPIENFEFVSQLAQFSQIQQAETTNERLLTLLQSDAASQAVGLLGQEVVIPAGASQLTGTVSNISFENGEPTISLTTENGQTVSNISLNSISQIREGE